MQSAVFLAVRAGEGDFGTAFRLVQAAELVAGVGNLALLAPDARDGMRMSGRVARLHPGASAP